MLRSMIRTCSYNPLHIRSVRNTITRELLERSNGGNQMDSEMFPLDLISFAEKSGIADIRILDFIDIDTVTCVPEWVLKALLKDCNTMLEYTPFDLVTIHDSFGALLCDMSDLFVVVREQFVELYKHKPLESLMKDIGGDISNVAIGDLDINLVLDSEYCFA